MKVKTRPVLPLLHFGLVGLMLLSNDWVRLGSGMEVMVTPNVVKLNGTSAKLTCTFNSCYDVNDKHFTLNWTYQECENCTEDLISSICRFYFAFTYQATFKRVDHITVGLESHTDPDQFVQFRRRVIISKTDRFWGRVEWSGNLEKNDVSVTIHDIQTSDEGVYRCYVLNPPDRHKGLGTIHLSVVTEVAPERDSTVAVIIGASVGGFLAVVILILVIVKCVRRKKKQDNQSEDQKTEEEGKTDGEGNQEEEQKRH